MKLVRPGRPGRRASVTVVIPCYNYGKYLPGCVTSALEQDGVDVEVVIVVHGAWYVNRDLAARGAIGRSEGCFAFEQDQVGQIIDRLGAGRLILATRA